MVGMQVRTKIPPTWRGAADSVENLIVITFQLWCEGACFTLVFPVLKSIDMMPCMMPPNRHADMNPHVFCFLAAIVVRSCMLYSVFSLRLIH